MGFPLDLANISAIPTWGLVAFGLTVLGAVLAGLVGLLSRKAPAWTLGLVPPAGVAGFAAASAPNNMVTLSVALASTGLALAMLLTGSLALAPARTGEDDDGRK